MEPPAWSWSTSMSETIMKALVEPSGRIAQVATDTFDVAAPLAWVEVPPDTTTEDKWDGTQVVKYVPPPAPVPATVTRFQGRQALRDAGLFDQVEALVNDPATDDAVRIRWADLTVFERHSSFIAALAPQLDPPLLPADIDALFIAAAAIE